MRGRGREARRAQSSGFVAAVPVAVDVARDSSLGEQPNAEQETMNISGTSAIQERKERSKSGNERRRSMAVAAAAAHSTRVGSFIRAEFSKSHPQITQKRVNKSA